MVVSELGSHFPNQLFNQKDPVSTWQTLKMIMLLSLNQKRHRPANSTLWNEINWKEVTEKWDNWWCSRILALMSWGTSSTQWTKALPCMTSPLLAGGAWLSLHRVLWEYNLKCLPSYTSMEKTMFCSITVIIAKERAKNTIWLSAKNRHLNLKQLQFGLKRLLPLKKTPILHMLCLAGIGQMQTERLEASPELTS